MEDVTFDESPPPVSWYHYIYIELLPPIFQVPYFCDLIPTHFHDIPPLAMKNEHSLSDSLKVVHWSVTSVTDLLSHAMSLKWADLCTAI